MPHRTIKSVFCTISDLMFRRGLGRRRFRASLQNVEPVESRILLSATPALVRELGPGQGDFAGGGLTSGSGKLLFGLMNPQTFQLQPWSSDGTSAGTKLLKSMTLKDTRFSQDKQDPVTIGTKTFFVGENSVSGIESLWVTDGTTVGTVRIRDFGSMGPMHLTNVNGTLFFAAINGTNGRHEIWKSAGTTATLVKSFVQPFLYGVNGPQFTAVGGTLFFTMDDFAHGTELWKSNGTSSGTTMVKDIRPADSGGFNQGSDPAQLENLNGKLFFVADNGVTGAEPWISDGTAVGTTIIRDVFPGAAPSVMPSFQWGTHAAVGNKVYYAGMVDVSGSLRNALMVTDGTAAGTEALVTDTETSFHQFSSLTNVNGRLFFADTGGSENSVWVSNGTAAETTKVRDLLLYNQGQKNPLQFTAVGNVLYFIATDVAQSYGIELWRSDGTETGTVMVKDLNAGPEASNPQELTLVGNQLFFTASNTTHGREIYRLPISAAPVIGGFGGNVKFTRGSASIAVAGSATVSDSDSTDFSGGQLTLATTLNAQSGDQFFIRNQGTGAGLIGVSGANVLYGGIVIGVKSGGVGTTPLIVKLNASATVAGVQALIRNIRWKSTSASTLPRTILLSLSDGDGGFSTPLTKLIQIL